MASWTFSFLRRYSRKTCVCTVNNYADTMSAWSTTTLTPCQHGQRLRGHRVSNYADTKGIILLWKRKKLTKSNKKCNLIFSKLHVSVVNDYADTFEKLWRFPTDFKGIISQKRYLFKCVYSYNGHNLKTWKYPYLKKISGIHVVVD